MVLYPVSTYEFQPEVVCHVGFPLISILRPPPSRVISLLDLRILARGFLSRWFSSSQLERHGRRVWSETRPLPIPSLSPPYNPQRKPRDPPFGTPLGLPLWPSYHIKKRRYATDVIKKFWWVYCKYKVKFYIDIWREKESLLR